MSHNESGRNFCIGNIGEDRYEYASLGFDCTVIAVSQDCKRIQTAGFDKGEPTVGSPIPHKKDSKG